MADSVERGMDAMLLCWRQFETKYSKHKHHQSWLQALKQALSADEQDQVMIASKQADKEGDERLTTRQSSQTSQIAE